MVSTILQKKVRHWAVQEGAASEVAPRLENNESEVLAFVSEGEADSLVRAKFEVLKSLSYMVDAVMQDRSKEKWNALIEVLTPDVPLSNNKLAEAAMFVESMRSILESQDFVRALDIAKVAQFSEKNPSSQPNRWKRAGQIFAVPYKGLDLYPSYALDWTQGAKPLPIMAKILRLFADKDDWQKAFWFASLNSYLKNRMPKDLLKSHPEDVLRAAELEAIGVQHG
jgi:hypothetical protein